jgi:hypothetical protein
MPRHARLDSPETLRLRHVIVRGIERRKIVDDDVDREELVSRVGKMAEGSHTHIYAWALNEISSDHKHNRSPAGYARNSSWRTWVRRSCVWDVYKADTLNRLISFSTSCALVLSSSMVARAP